MAQKQLYRSRKTRMIAGIAGGLADYFDLDVALVRLFWIITIFLGGGGILAYLIAWVVIPEEDSVSGRNRPDESHQAEQSQNPEQPTTVIYETTAVQHDKVRKLSGAGVVLIAVGLIILFKDSLPWHMVKFLWPVALIGLGLFLLIRR
jgi:phage shock protein C